MCLFGGSGSWMAFSSFGVTCWCFYLSNHNTFSDSGSPGVIEDQMVLALWGLASILDKMFCPRYDISSLWMLPWGVTTHVSFLLVIFRYVILMHLLDIACNGVQHECVHMGVLFTHYWSMSVKHCWCIVTLLWARWKALTKQEQTKQTNLIFSTCSVRLI